MKKIDRKWLALLVLTGGSFMIVIGASLLRQTQPVTEQKLESPIVEETKFWPKKQYKPVSIYL